MFLQLGFQWILSFVLTHSIVLFLQELVTALTSVMRIALAGFNGLMAPTGKP